MKRYFILLLYIIPCFAEDAYSFITNYEKGETDKYKEESLWSFEMPYGSTESGNSTVKTIECLGYNNNFLMLKETITDIVATKKTLGKLSSDYDANRLIGVPYTLFIDTLTGKVDHFETDFKQHEELIRTLIMGFDDVDNALYPFGTNATNIHIGDSWEENADSIAMYMGDEENPNYMIVKARYTLDKIKNKKGNIIAYISGRYTMNANIEFIQDSKVFEGKISGTMKDKIRFNLNENKKIVNKMSGSMDFALQFEGEGFSSTIDITSIVKKVN